MDHECFCFCFNKKGNANKSCKKRKCAHGADIFFLVSRNVKHTCIGKKESKMSAERLCASCWKVFQLEVVMPIIRKSHDAGVALKGWYSLLKKSDAPPVATNS